MISRCPSCGAQVDDEATRCPSCHWDFIALKRMPPEDAGAAPKAEGGGLAQFPKLDPKQKRPAPTPEPTLPLALPQFDSPAALPSVPAQVAPPSSAAKPPARELPWGQLPRAKPAQPPLPEPRKSEPTPPPGPSPVPAAKAPGEAPRAVPDAAARFRPQSQSHQAQRPAPQRWPMWQSILAAGVAVAVISMGVIHILLRSEVPVAQRGPDPSLFSDQPEDVKLEGAEPTAQSQVQRAALDFAGPGPGPASTSAQEPASQAPARMPSAPRTAAAPGPAVRTPGATALLAASAPRESPKPKPGPLWVFQGEVYDLITLHPVFSAKIEFKEPSGASRGAVATNGEGGYQIILPALNAGGYQISVTHPDYLEKYLDEITPPFREVDKAQRSFLAQSASSNRPWIGKPSALTKRNFVLIPRSAQP